MKVSKVRQTILRIADIELEIKRLYEQQDALIALLIEVKECAAFGAVVERGDGKKFEFADNFAEKNLQFRACGFRRFGVREVKKAKE